MNIEELTLTLALFDVVLIQLELGDGTKLSQYMLQRNYKYLPFTISIHQNNVSVFNDREEKHISIDELYTYLGD